MSGRVIAGETSVATATYTRPADTTAYNAGDVIADSTSAATILTFSNVRGVSGKGLVIQAATLIDSAAPATKLDAELYLFDTAPVMEQDNAAWDPSDAELLRCLGVIAFPTASFKTCGGNGIIHVRDIGLPVVPVAGVDSIYGILIARNAYTPASGEVFKILLHLRQD